MKSCLLVKLLRYGDKDFRDQATFINYIVSEKRVNSKLT